MSALHHPSHDNKGEYHGHPPYVLIWAILVACLGLSLAIGYMGNKELAVALIFTVAIAKALLVFGNFMHLRWEPKILSAFVVFAIMCLFFFYFGVAPDIVHADLHPM